MTICPSKPGLPSDFLLLRRPPGREAYPGDVFYLHSRLLERAARVNADYVEKFTNGEVKGKTGSLTALPDHRNPGRRRVRVRADQRDLDYRRPDLPETDLFNAGIRPAINAGISVSRVGGAAQTKVIKKLGGGIRLALAQYRELASFAQLPPTWTKHPQKQLQHGEIVTELMKQKILHPEGVGDGADAVRGDQGFLKACRSKGAGVRSGFPVAHEGQSSRCAVCH